MLLQPSLAGYQTCSKLSGDLKSNKQRAYIDLGIQQGQYAIAKANMIKTENTHSAEIWRSGVFKVLMPYVSLQPSEIQNTAAVYAGSLGAMLSTYRAFFLSTIILDIPPVTQ